MQFFPSKSRFAFDKSVELIPRGPRGHVYLWTFTFVDCLDVEGARRRWSEFLARFNVWRRRHAVEFGGVRVFELHKHHGLHIHVVTSAYWRVNDVRHLWQLPSVGGGRVHVLPIPGNRAGYIGKYLTKSRRPECFRGVRVWSSFGGGEYCRVRDVKVESNWTRAYHALKAALGPMFSRLRWYEKQLAVANVERLRPWWFGLGVAVERRYAVEGLVVYAV